MYQEIEGNLITLALEGKFDVIAHGCNCFCTMGAGIALPMAQTFGADIIDNEYEAEYYKCLEWHRSEKLGNIDWYYPKNDLNIDCPDNLIVVNAYTQYHLGPNLDIDALTLCLRKMNFSFSGKHIGLPQIGCGIAGGDWNIVSEIIKKELANCKVTVVIFDK